MKYHTVWKQFNNFLVKLDRRPKAWEDRTALYCAHLVQEGFQWSTIKSYISAIKADNYEWNEKEIKLSIITRACKIKNDKLIARLPIRKGFLELILFEIQRMYSGNQPQPYLEIMYKALYSLTRNKLHGIWMFYFSNFTYLL